jgi:hypothetical protein
MISRVGEARERWAPTLMMTGLVGHMRSLVGVQMICRLTQTLDAHVQRYGELPEDDSMLKYTC